MFMTRPGSVFLATRCQLGRKIRAYAQCASRKPSNLRNSLKLKTSAKIVQKVSRSQKSGFFAGSVWTPAKREARSHQEPHGAFDL